MSDPNGTDPASAEPARHGVLDLLRLPGFLRLLAIRFPSQTADGMFQIGAAGFLLFSLDPNAATSARDIAWVLIITTIPFSIAGPFAGVVIDRWRRQRILAWSNLIRTIVIAASLPFASPQLLGWSSGEAIFFGAVLIVLSLNRFFLATLGAVLPRVVPGQGLVPANAISSTGGSVASLLGAGLGGAIAGSIGDTSGGPEVAVGISGLLLLVSAFAAARFPADVLGPDLDGPLSPLRGELRQAGRDLADGLRVMLRTRRAWAPIAAMSYLRLFITSSFIAGLLVFRNVFGGGSAAVAEVLVWFGIGVAVGAVAISVVDGRLERFRPEVAIRLAMAFTGIAIVLLAPGLRRPALLAMSFAMGLGFGVAKVATDTLVQGALPDRYRGRLFTAYDIVYNGSFLLGGVLAAIVLPTTDRAEGVYLASGIALVLGAIISRSWLSRLPAPVDIADWDRAQHLLD